MSARLFISQCPNCNIEIIGNDNWEEGEICIQGYCETCKYFILEDEVTWIRACDKCEKIQCICEVLR